MKLKKLNLMISSLVLLVVLLGCGGSSSSNSQSEEGSQEKEKIAIYIPIQELQTQKVLSKATKSIPLVNNKYSKLIKENSERDNVDGKWIVYDKSPSGANISIVYDDVAKNKVIELNGDGLKNGYVLGYWAQPGSWNDKEHKIIQWSMKYNEDYYVYVRVSTTKGYRYLYYTPSDGNYGIAEGYDAPHYIHHGLGRDSIDGTWKIFTRDLEADLKDFDPDNTLVSVDGFFVRGSGRINDVTLFHKSEEPSILIREIDRWLINEGVARSKGENIVISKDKIRAIIKAFNRSETSTYTYIFDISNLKNIVKLVKRVKNRDDISIDVKIKENDYIILARHKEFLIYDYRTGVLLNKDNIKVNNRFYLTIKENYTIVSRFISDKNILQKIDFTNRSNPVVTQLYEGDKSIRYTLASDGLSVFVSDKKGQDIEEILLEDKEIKKKIKKWLSDNNLKGTIGRVSDDTSRIIVNAHKINTSSPDITLILDSSDLNNIQELSRKNLDRYENINNDVIKDNDYIIVLGKRVLLIYDYQTATLLSNIILGEANSTIKYLLVEDNKIIYVDKIPNALKVLNFTDRINPSMITAYQDDNAGYAVAVQNVFSVIVVYNKNNQETIEDLYFE